MTPRRFAHADELLTLVGSEVAVSDWIAIDTDRVQRFADATGDQQWIHLDAERAQRESPFGVAVAHGYLTLSLLPMWMQQCLHVDGLKFALNYGLNRVRFPAPVAVGSRLRCRFELKATKKIDGGYHTEWLARVETERGDKPVCVAECLMRYYPLSP